MCCENIVQNLGRIQYVKVVCMPQNFVPKYICHYKIKFLFYNLLFCHMHMLHFVGNNKDFSSVSIPVTFTYGINRTSAIVPVFQDKIIENVETFDVNIGIPSALKYRISPGRQRKAIASIIDSTSK